jgi:very-short-patch-repair endonuclease
LVKFFPKLVRGIITFNIHPYHKENGYSAKDIWKRDNKKTNFAKNEGFSVLVIWDSEYRKNPQQTLKKCIEFINS